MFESLFESIKLFGWVYSEWGSLDLISKVSVALLIAYPVLNIIVELTPTQIDNIALKFVIDKLVRPLVQGKQTRAAVAVGPVVAAAASVDGKSRNRERKSKLRPDTEGDMSSGDG